MVQFVYDDGGRAAAGFKGTAGDCAVRAVDGALHDTYNGSRNGTRCVYGYWRG
jgi:hypothetical protein